MSGYADYFGDDLRSYDQYEVQTIIATPENFKSFGTFCDTYDKHDVIICEWPITGKRKLFPGTGKDGGIAEGNFIYSYERHEESIILKAQNQAVGGKYITGIQYDTSLTPQSYPKYILTREANYHPDGGQVFYSAGKPFMLLLAKSGDDITPSDFVCFKFDGSKSVQIYPNVWHQPAYPLDQQMTLKTKQGKVHACVPYDSINEHKCWLKIKLEN